MAKITQKDTTKLGQLARIGISDSVAETLAPQLDRILDYVTQLQEVDTSQTDTTDQVTSLVDIWREDEVTDSGYSREELLRNAPMTQDGYIKVRRVL